ncbi:MAG: site-specific integrase, partial [Acidobacteriota bacterium]|nr:site-specific integrase [Acidobacteriota bacterium]
MAEGRKNATINREVELLRRALRLGAERRKIVRLPIMPKKLPEKNARQGFFETNDFLRIIPHLPTPFDDIARFAFSTGWRCGMLLGMRWEHVDRAGRLVTLPDSKNDDPQSIPLEDELRELVERRWRARDYRTALGGAGVSQYVFHVEGRPIEYWRFNKTWVEARIAVGLPGKLFHDLRRTAARNMVRGGVADEIAMKVTGHRTRSMFNRYNIASLEDKLEALKKARVYA